MGPINNELNECNKMEIDSDDLTSISSSSPTISESSFDFNPNSTVLRSMNSRRMKSVSSSNSYLDIVRGTKNRKNRMNEQQIIAQQQEEEDNDRMNDQQFIN